MSPALPIVSGKTLLKSLLKNGYLLTHRKGSHCFVESADGTLGTVIPVHSNEDLGKGILKSILNDLNLSVSDLIALLK